MPYQHSRTRRYGQLALTFATNGGVLILLSSLPWLIGHDWRLSPDALGPLAVALLWGVLAAVEEQTQPWPPKIKDGEDSVWRKLALIGLWSLLPLSSWDARFHGVTFSVGLALVLAGAGLRVWSLRELGPLFTWHAGVTSEHRIVRSGPYRYLKHPNYVGNILFAGGIVLTCGSQLGWLGFAVVLFSIIYTARHEESVLRRHLPGYH